MGENPRSHCNPMQRAAALAQLAYRNIVDVAEEYDVSVRTIARWQQHFQETGSYERRQGTGDWRITTAEEDNILINYVSENPFRPLTHAVQATGFPGNIFFII
jgi:transposase